MEDCEGQSNIANITFRSPTAFETGNHPEWKPIRQLSQRNSGPIPSSRELRSAAGYRHQVVLGFGYYRYYSPPGQREGTKDSNGLQAFHDSFRTGDIRRVVSLRMRTSLSQTTNQRNVENNFKMLETRLKKIAILRYVHYKHMLNYMQRRQVYVVDPDEKQEEMFYLPHHAVSKGKQGETKWQIEFGASSHESGEPLEVGSNLLLELFATLLQFRLHPPAIIGEINQERHDAHFS